MLKWFPEQPARRRPATTCSSTTCRASSRSAPRWTSRVVPLRMAGRLLRGRRMRRGGRHRHPQLGRREDLEFVRTFARDWASATYGITTQTREDFLGHGAVELPRPLRERGPTEDFFLLEAHRQRFVSSTKAFARRGWVVQSVEPTDRVEEVFCAEVEDGHAFALEDNILTGNCFGCGEGGDVITFLMKIDASPSPRRSSGSPTGRRPAASRGGDVREERPRGPQRGRLVEAHQVAQEFYAEQLGDPRRGRGRGSSSPSAASTRRPRSSSASGSPRATATRCSRHLRPGFTEEEISAAGLVAIGRSAYDRFRGRLLWPIRDISGDTIGFGARRIFDDDRIEAKYLNTPETPIYKKSQVLYGSTWPGARSPARRRR